MLSHLPSNKLWGLLEPERRAALSPVVVELRARDVLYEPGMPGLYVYFPLNVVISFVSTMSDGSSAEVALVGREGMVGLAAVLGAAESPTLAVVQIAGTALRVAAAKLRSERLWSPSLRAVLDLYTEARLIQLAQTAACNRLHVVESRLARWLLAIADRIDADHFILPQELMAQMLGVQRPTVSLRLQALRKSGVISFHGRTLTIVDRAGLERLACECHGLLRREFERLFRLPIEGLHLLPDVPRPSATSGTGQDAKFEAIREIAGRLLLASIREQEARDQAEAANRAKDQFLATVSHELRTPLNAIIGWSAILQERRDESPARGLAVIQRNAQALLKLVEELLDAARITSATLTIQSAPVNLRNILCNAVEMITLAADAKGVAVRSSVPDEVMPLEADADRLRQVFVNVLSNALKFTDAPGSIDVCASFTARHARVVIRDTGRGIIPEVLPHVFERFRQGADSTKGQHGLGLGLSIARVLVELHAGTIQIASDGEGRGTTCTIELPLAAVPTAPSVLLRTVGADR